LNEDDTRQLLNDSETGLAPEQIQQLIGYLLSKKIIDERVAPLPPPVAPPPPPPVAPSPPPPPPPVIPDDGERKAEPPIMPIIDDINPVLERYKEEAMRQPPEFYIGRIESKAGIKQKVDREVAKIAPREYRKQLSQFIIQYYVPRSGLWEELPDKLPEKRLPLDSEPIKRRKKGRGLTMEDLRTKTSSGIKKKLGLIPPSGVILGKGLNISDMTPAQLMNNLALNIASQKAGNSGVSDVINAIIDQMHKKNIISKAEHKKLWYAYCD
jgi:hypothetical protein